MILPSEENHSSPDAVCISSIEPHSGTVNHPLVSFCSLKLFIITVSGYYGNNTYIYELNFYRVLLKSDKY